MNTKLEAWRKQIDALDKKIIATLAKRISVAKKIGEYKKSQRIAPLDTNRWKKVSASRLSDAGKLGLSKKFVKDFLQLIHKYSLKYQK